MPLYSKNVLRSAPNGISSIFHEFDYSILHALSTIIPISDGKILGKILNLGEYSHDHEWREEDRLNDALTYHSQFYTNGTECDLTGSYRKTEVKVGSLFCLIPLNCSQT